MTALAPDVANTHQKKLLKLVRRRLERFATLLPKLLVSNDSETVHQLRVASRRLQQALRLIQRRDKPRKNQKVLRLLRQVRQCLGPCRDVDVNIELIVERRKHAGATVAQDAWQAVQNSIEEQRGPALKRARRAIAQLDLFAFIAQTKSLTKGIESDLDPLAVLGDGAQRSTQAWEEAFAQAYEQRDEFHLHQLRIASKRLRYRAELLGDLGRSEAKLMVGALKELQTMLGDWHDRCVLLKHVADFIGRPDFLASHPDMGRALLAEIEKEKLRNDNTIDQLLQNGAKLRQNLARWKPAADETEEGTAA